MIEIIELYKKIKPEIESSITRFKQIGSSNDLKIIFPELCFCLLTPQSKARMADKIMKSLIEKDWLYTKNLDDEDFRDEFRFVRFKNNKANYLIELRNKIFNENYPILNLINSDPILCRETLVKDIKGFGYKEASHFLRNIGKGENLAILDRHILRNMAEFRVVDEIPKSLNKNQYLACEKELLKFAKVLDIPPDHLDFVLWYKEAGEVFK